MEILDQLIKARAEQKQAKIDKINFNEGQMFVHLMKVKELYPALVETLAKQKLEIATISPVKTGMSSDWEDGDHMKVALRVKPISNTFKFIKFGGYNKDGRGLNQTRLQTRATKLADAIKAGTGLESVNVNPFSFEYGNRTDKPTEVMDRTILVDFWIKLP